MDRQGKRVASKVATAARVARPRASAASELADARAQQAAVNEILRVMADSPADLMVVLDAIAEQAARLCRAPFARMTVIEGDVLRPVAGYAADNQPAGAAGNVPLARTSIQGRAILERRTLHFEDIAPIVEQEFPAAVENARTMGFRAVLAVPLLRRDDALGALFLYRREPGLFPPDQVALVETFARQAAIALHSVQQFRATQEALEQQTATSEILRVINRARDDVQPVFDTIAQSALTLCEASSSLVVTLDGGLLHVRGLATTTPEGANAVNAIFPRPPSRDNGATRAVQSSRVEMIPDVLADPEFGTTAASMASGFRSVLAVPLMRDGSPIGAISVGRPVAGSFPPSQVELLQTFAAQAVIAIENVRLFNELGERNAALTESLEQRTATSDILGVISRSPTDVQPVLETIAENALRLCEGIFSAVSRFDGELIHIGALRNITPEGDAAFERAYPCKPNRNGTTQRAILTGQVVHMPDVRLDAEYAYHDVAQAAGFRSVLAVPMLRDGKPVGAITVYRAVAEAFPEAKIELLRTFADQAVIAVENVRLFTELDARNRDLTEALEQQTATSDILRVISQSQTNVQPVFDTIARSALTLCAATSAIVVTLDGETVRLAASANVSPHTAEAMRRRYPRPRGRGTATLRAIETRAVVSIPNSLEDDEYDIVNATDQFRSALAVPLLRDGVPIGAIGLGWPEPGDHNNDGQVGLLKTFADQAVIAIENVRLFTELQARNRDLSEALEHQTATSEILRVIARTPGDVQPVFDTIAASALKLCKAASALVTRRDGDMVTLVASANLTEEGAAAMRETFPMPIGMQSTSARSLLLGKMVAIPDIMEDADYQVHAQALRAAFRATLAVPLMHEGRAVGTITVGNPEPGRYPDSQIALLQTFADQAVIAIENVRLFNELGARNRDLMELLEQQTATSDILRVISKSPTDVQPVFRTIATAALELCGAVSANVFTFDGELVHLGAFVNANPAYGEELLRMFPRPLSRDYAVTRALMSCDIVQIPDVHADPEYALGAHSSIGGFRSNLAVPLMREGRPVGAIVVGRPEPGTFPANQIELLKTFADQAVIAIENVRLFNELGARNRELTEALEQQTATSDILRVISQSQTDTQPVFDTIVGSVLALCDAAFSGVYLVDGDVISLAATAGMTPEATAEFRAGYPRKLGRDTVSGRALLECRVVQTEDLMGDRDYAGAPGTFVGARTVLGVPLVRDGRAIGSIGVWRNEVKLFSETQIALLQTFADQAVIAIENVRLFNELNARTRELTRSVGELRALGEVGQAVSSTLDLGTVLSTIVSRARQLSGVDGGSVYEYDAQRQEFILHSSDGLPDDLLDALRKTPMRPGEGALGRMAITGQPVEIRDVVDEQVYRSRVRDLLVKLGLRSMLAVPLLREGHLLGGLVINRKAPGAFDPQVVELMKTFAAQSAIAIENARLFREIEIKSRELETASRHKSEFLANMSHELRTPLNAIIGFSEVLAERLFGELNDKQSEYVADIADSGRHLLTLINDILDLSKIEAGRMELDAGDVDLGKAIAQTLSLVRERAERRGIALSSVVDERIGTVYADARKVKQVILNLLSNALKFTPEGGRIAVCAAAFDDRVEVSVTDTGIGIAPEDQASVFEEFRQVGTSAARAEGTGLGLAISRKFIELHGGRMWLESAPGKGSTFSFSLPLRRP